MELFKNIIGIVLVSGMTLAMFAIITIAIIMLIKVIKDW